MASMALGPQRRLRAFARAVMCANCTTGGPYGIVGDPTIAAPLAFFDAPRCGRAEYHGAGPDIGRPIAQRAGARGAGCAHRAVSRHVAGSGADGVNLSSRGGS